MANALVERLCQVETIPDAERIAREDWRASMILVLHGLHTVLQLKNEYGITGITEQEDKVDLWVANINGQADDAGRHRAVEAHNGVLTFWELRFDYPRVGYQTPEEIEIKLDSI